MEPIEAHPLIRQSRVMVVPGVYDALSARIAERAGFPAVVLTGYGVSAAYLGEPDFGILTQSEMLDVARRVISAVGRPELADVFLERGIALNVRDADFDDEGGLAHVGLD